MDLTELQALPLFSGLDADIVRRLEGHLDPVPFAPGQDVVVEGDPAEHFFLVVEGRAEVHRHRPGQSERELALIGPGAIVGEVALLFDRPRVATVTARSPLRTARGDAGAFEELLADDTIRSRLVELGRVRLAADVDPVALHVPPAPELRLRPMLPSDRDALAAAARAASAETLRKRFLTGGPPTERMLDYLVNINYVDHFALVALDHEHHDRPIAVARYVRLRTRPDAAEMAFTVRDDIQSRGIGTVLLGAIGAIAPMAGVATLTGELRSDNAAMRRVLAKAEAAFSASEPGVTHAEVPASAASRLIPPADRTRLRDAAALVLHTRT